jgi:3-oxoacyl-[acyl-carrier protein] reductase
MDLRNATAVVTGGTSGIGYGIARALSQAGAKVAVTGRNKTRLDETAKALGVLPIRADVTEEADARRTFHEAIEAFGHVDILVNNAGIGVFRPLVDMDLAAFESVFRTNVTGAMLMAREAAKHFISRKSGNIVNICSTASHRGAPNGTAYYASKAALRMMTEVWRAELRQHNIRVMLINPSEVLTNFGVLIGNPQKPNPTKLHPEDIAHMVRAVLEMDSRGFTTELTVFATNPKD